MAFFAIGMYVQNRKQKVKNGWKKNIVIAGLWLILSVFNGKVDMYQQINGRNWMFFCVTGLLGTYLILYISRYIETKQGSVSYFLNMLGKNTMIILITH